MFNRERYIRLGYMIKANKIYTFIPVFVMLLLLWGNFFYPVNRITTIQIMQMAVPYISLFWLLPIKEERLTVGWGEVLCTVEGSGNLLLAYIGRNMIYMLMFAGLCYCYAKRLGSLHIVFVEVAFQVIMIQGVGFLFLYLSNSMFTALLVPFLFLCVSLMLLGQSEGFFIKGYICGYEVALGDFFGQQWFYLAVGMVCNGFLFKK